MGSQDIGFHGQPKGMRPEEHIDRLEALNAALMAFPRYAHDNGYWRCRVCKSTSHSVDGPASLMVHADDCPANPIEELLAAGETDE